MDSYNKFISNNISKGKLFIDTDDSEYSSEWILTIDVSKIWNNYYSKQISLIDFNNEYAITLTENSENIASTCGEQCWNEIEPYAINELKKATNIEESELIYNKLYDLYDKYEILIKIDNNNNEIPGNL